MQKSTVVDSETGKSKDSRLDYFPFCLKSFGINKDFFCVIKTAKIVNFTCMFSFNM